MTKASRLERLIETQHKLRTLDLAELERRRQILAVATAARDHLLSCMTSASPQDPGWLAGRVGAYSRSCREVETAEAQVLEQSEKVKDTAFIAQLSTRLHARMVRAEQARLEVGALAETIERLSIGNEDSAAQD